MAKPKQIKYNLHFLDGTTILQSYGDRAADGKTVVVVDTNIINKTEQYKTNALLYQILSCMDETEREHEDALLKTLVYVEFPKDNLSDYKDDFEQLMFDGMHLQFCDADGRKQGELIHFVPFEKSNSQARAGVISFIRADLFHVLRPVIDLDLPLENRDDIRLDYLSRLYSYRGLYLSDAQLIATGADKEFCQYINEKSVIVVNDITIQGRDQKVRVYTADAGENNQLTPKDEEQCVEINCFDGEGIISPDFADWMNKRMAADEENVSFQVRMPFFKGVLHRVDFHSFFKEIGLDENAVILDAFGRPRKLQEAKAIVPTSMFKLCSLKIRDLFKKRDDLKDTDPMAYYFEKVRKYNHGLYLVKSDDNFHNHEPENDDAESGHEMSHLTYQFLSTLDLSDKDFNELVQEHIDYADLYTMEKMAEAKENPDIDQRVGQTQCARLLKLAPVFAQDPILQKQLEETRISLYKEMALGRILVKGETRFLSGDLLYYLYRLAIKATEAKDEVTQQSLNNIDTKIKKKIKKKVRRCMGNGMVYLPGWDMADEVALFRSPHLSRNEDVYARVFREDDKEEENRWYTKYFSHLRNVAMVGYHSYIPAALGGADFDGDTIQIIADPRVVRASRSGYVEGCKQSLPFINIKPLKKDKSTEKKCEYKYVYPAAIYGTFNSRVGRIANAALRLATVEYSHLEDNELEKGLSAALCTIMTGNEIDSAKTGEKPYIQDALSFNAKDSQKRVVAEAKKFLAAKDVLKSFEPRYPVVFRMENGIKSDESAGDNDVVKENGIKFKESAFGKNFVVYPNVDLPPICRLLYLWAERCLVNGQNAKEKPDKWRGNQGLWESTLPCPKEVGDILKDCNKALTEYKRMYNLQNKLKNTNDSLPHTDHIRTILKLQYDNIYAAEEGISRDASYFRLEEAVLNSGITYEQVQALREKWFAEKEKKNKKKNEEKNEEKNEPQYNPELDFETFWPFSDAEEREECLAEIQNNLVYTDIVKNFNANGYRLLGYLLERVGSVLKDEETFERESSRDHGRYDAMLRTNLAGSVKKSAFEKKLAKKAKEDIQALFPEGSKQKEIIESVYLSIQHKTRLNAFWTIYPVSEVLKIMEGDTDD